jgi:hypothetical protein
VEQGGGGDLAAAKSQYKASEWAGRRMLIFGRQLYQKAKWLDL